MTASGHQSGWARKHLPTIAEQRVWTTSLDAGVRATLAGATTLLAGCQTGTDQPVAQSPTEEQTPSMTATDTRTATTTEPETERPTDTPASTDTPVEPVDPTVAGWPQFGGTGGNTFAVTGRSVPTAKFTEQWRQTFTKEKRTEGIATEIVADGEYFYEITTQSDGEDILRARSQTDGTAEWELSVDGYVYSSLAVNDGSVYVCGATFRSIAATSGTVEWEIEGRAEQTVVSGGRLFVHRGNEQSQFAVLDASDGSVIWEQSVVSEDFRGIHTPHAVADGRVYMPVDLLHGTDAQPRIKAYAADSGELMWNTPVEGTYPRMVASSEVVFAVTEKRLYALDPASGAVLWKKRGESASMAHVDTTSIPAVHDSVAYATIGETLHALAVKTGTSNWDNPDSTRPLSYVDGYLYGRSTNGVKVYDATTGSLETEYTVTDRGYLKGDLIPLDDSVLVKATRTKRTDAGENVDEVSLISLGGER